MTETMVQVIATNPSAYQCYDTPDGIERWPRPCSHATPLSAITHASAPSSAADSLPPSERLSGAPNAAPPVADAGQGFGSAGVRSTLGL